MIGARGCIKIREIRSKNSFNISDSRKGITPSPVPPKVVDTCLLILVCVSRTNRQRTHCFWSFSLAQPWSYLQCIDKACSMAVPICLLSHPDLDPLAMLLFCGYFGVHCLIDTGSTWISVSPLLSPLNSVVASQTCIQSANYIYPDR